MIKHYIQHLQQEAQEAADAKGYDGHSYQYGWCMAGIEILLNDLKLSKRQLKIIKQKLKTD
jgi:hypothetical protein